MVVAFVLGNNYFIGSVVGMLVALWGYAKAVDGYGSSDLAFTHLRSAWPSVTLLSLGIPAATMLFVLLQETSFIASVGWHWTSEELASVAGFVAVAAVFSATVEELFFRGLLLRLMAHHMGLIAAVFGQAILFALMHALGPTGIGNYRWVYLVLVGVVTALLFLHTRSLLAAVILHGIWNVSGLLTAGLMQYEVAPPDKSAPNLHNTSASIVAVSIVVWGIACLLMIAVYFRHNSLRRAITQRALFLSP